MHSVNVLFWMVIYFFIRETYELNASRPEQITKRKLKILVYNYELGFSHIQFQGRLADTLAEAGHEVHMLFQDFTNTFGNFTGSKKCQKIYRQKTNVPIDYDKFNVFNRPFDGNYKLLINNPITIDFIKTLSTLSSRLVNDEKLTADLTAEKYDVAIAEMYSPGTFGYFHKIKVGTKLASLAVPLHSMTSWVFGVPNFSSFVPNLMSAPLNGAKMTFVERIINFYNVVYETYRQRHILYDTEQLSFTKAYGPDFPSLLEITRNISLVFVNTNPLFGLPMPTTQKTIFIGGIVQSNVIKPIKKDIMQVLEKTQRGVVLFSFGTLADTKKMSASMRNTFLKAFDRLPEYDFIWRFESNSEQDEILIPKNVHLFKWIDQKSILKHKNVKAFITHCGMNSINEAAFAGVPLIGVPLFGDQYYNAATIKEHGIGEVFEITEAENEAVIYSAVKKVLDDPKYTKNVHMLKKKLSLTPFSATENFVKWVEFAAEFKNLNELNLPLESDLGGVLAYYNFDVVLLSLFVLTVMIGILIMVFKVILTNAICIFKQRQKLE